MQQSYADPTHSSSCLLQLLRCVLQAGDTQQCSVLFSYVQTDDYCDRAEMDRHVTTSAKEHSAPLVQKLLLNPRNRQKVRRSTAAQRAHTHL